MDTGKKWLALEIRVDEKAAEAIEFALNDLESLGTEINNLGKAQSETVCVIGYFNERPNGENVQNQLNEALRIYGFSSDAIEQTEWREIKNIDWLAEWKKHWKPTETEKFIIAPSWETIGNTEKIAIKIEPSMAFGTGTHETTRLCLRAIEENFSPSMSFLDVGTGTGILAIAAAKIKFQVQSSKFKVKDSDSQTLNFELKTLNSISACDTDEDSIKIAKENAELNDANEIKFYVGTIDKTTPKFDFVCANVTADVIIPLLPLLIEKSGKTLVLSGILKEQENLIVGELSKFQISNFKIEVDGEWISILVVSD